MLTYKQSPQIAHAAYATIIHATPQATATYNIGAKGRRKSMYKDNAPIDAHARIRVCVPDAVLMES